MVDLGSQPIRNLRPVTVCPAAYTGSGAGWRASRWFGGGAGAGTYSIVETPTAWSARFARKTWTASGGSNGDTGFDIFDSTLPSSGFAVRPGERWSHVFIMRPSVGDKTARATFYWFDAAGVALTVPNHRTDVPVGTLPGGVFTIAFASVVIPAGVAYMRVFPDIGGGGALWAPGDTLDLAATAVYEGVVTGFHSGDYPGWRWTGAANASPSVGYPYTLESIAGRPLLTLAGIGSAPTTFAALPALAGRTTYMVSDRVASNAAVQAVLVNTMPSTVNQTGQMRLGSAGIFEFRPQFVGGLGAGGVYASGISSIPAVGSRSVVCAAQTEGLAAFDFELNGGLNANQRASRTGMTVGSGYSDGAAPGINSALGTQSGAFETPVYAIQYRGYHEAETRRRVSAWLARQYGAPVPAGF